MTHHEPKLPPPETVDRGQLSDANVRFHHYYYYYIIISPSPSSVGGKEELRPYWQRYMSKAITLVFVVDSSSQQLFPVAEKLLHELLASDPHLPLMVLANKQVSVTGNTSLHFLTKDLRFFSSPSPSPPSFFFLKNQPQFVLCCNAYSPLLTFVQANRENRFVWLYNRQTWW